MAFQITQDELQRIKKERLKEYNRLYKLAKGKREIDKRDLRFKPEKREMPVSQPYKGAEDVEERYFTGITEDICCSFFGCGKVLSMREKLFGDRCINHPKNQNL